MVEEVLELKKEDHLVLCGDYVDRGPDTKGLIDYILQLQEDGYRVECLMGNHEAMMLHGLEYPNNPATTWLFNGGRETLASYGCSHPDEFPKSHIDFYKSLKLFHQVDKYLFVHAGVGTGRIDPLEDKKALLWSRNWYPDLDYDWLDNRYIIHGHTPHPGYETETMLKHFDENRVINIDCGCVYTTPGLMLGKLCALDLSNRQLHFQEYLG